MTIPRIMAINQYHRRNPPLHIMVAAYLDAGSAGPASSIPSAPAGTDNEGKSLFDIFPKRG